MTIAPHLSPTIAVAVAVAVAAIVMPRCAVSVAQRARVLALLDVDISIKRVEEITGLSRSTILPSKLEQRKEGIIQARTMHLRMHGLKKALVLDGH